MMRPATRLVSPDSSPSLKNEKGALQGCRVGVVGELVRRGHVISFE